MTTEPSDRILVGRLFRGDEESFSQFFDAAFVPLFEAALARTGGDGAAAEEMVQTALCHAVQNEATLIETLRRAGGNGPAVDADRAARVRKAVHAEWQSHTTRRAKKRVFTALAVAAVLAALVIFVNCPAAQAAALTR